MYSQNNIDIKKFLSQYWQKKPLVIKQGFDNFIDPLDEHDLAGLSQEPFIDSRIVSHTDHLKM
jgi:50S ribosomal protein L16 3-hydroxylase